MAQRAFLEGRPLSFSMTPRLICFETRILGSSRLILISDLVGTLAMSTHLFGYWRRPRTLNVGDDGARLRWPRLRRVSPGKGGPRNAHRLAPKAHRLSLAGRPARPPAPRCIPFAVTYGRNEPMRLLEEWKPRGEGGGTNGIPFHQLADIFSLTSELEEVRATPSRRQVHSSFRSTIRAPFLLTTPGEALRS